MFSCTFTGPFGTIVCNIEQHFESKIAKIVLAIFAILFVMGELDKVGQSGTKWDGVGQKWDGVGRSGTEWDKSGTEWDKSGTKVGRSGT